MATAVLCWLRCEPPRLPVAEHGLPHSLQRFLQQQYYILLLFSVHLIFLLVSDSWFGAAGFFSRFPLAHFATVELLDIGTFCLGGIRLWSAVADCSLYVWDAILIMSLINAIIMPHLCYFYFFVCEASFRPCQSFLALCLYVQVSITGYVCTQS